MSQAGELDFLGNNPGVATSYVTNSGTAVPILNVLEILGAVEAAGTNPLRTVGSGNTVTVETQFTQAIASTNAANVGLAAFDSTFFSVDANGFVSFIGGGGSTEGFIVDAHTAPGTSPVVPDGSNHITVTGGQVAAGTNVHVIQTNSLAANNYIIQIQRSQAVASSTIGDNGVSHFDSSVFTVDANGFVSLKAGAVTLSTLTPQSGTTPVMPTAGGTISISGATVAAGTTPVATVGGTNVLTLNVQTAQAIASTAANKIGLASFNSADFTVDANGFVSAAAAVPTQFTGNTGTAVPSSGNLNILGGPGVTTSATGSTVTINSVVFTDQGSSTTIATNNGYYVTGAFTMTLPGSPNQGDLCIIDVDTSSTVTITANIGQVIRLASNVTSTAGSVTSGAQGDSLSLRYRSTGATWDAMSSSGGWIF